MWRGGHPSLRELSLVGGPGERTFCLYSVMNAPGVNMHARSTGDTKARAADMLLWERQGRLSKEEPCEQTWSYSNQRERKGKSWQRKDCVSNIKDQTQFWEPLSTLWPEA